MQKRYHTIFFEKMSLAASQKSPLFNEVVLSLNKYAFLSDKDFIDEMYKIAFNYAGNEEILNRLSITYAPSENFVKWAYCQVCKEFAIGIHRYNPKLDLLISSIEHSHICFTSAQINFLKKNYPDYKKIIKRLEKILPIQVFYTPSFLEENRENFQHYYRQLQCYDILFTEFGFLCDWKFSKEPLESFIVKLCSTRPELLEKIYSRNRFNIHEALLFIFKNDFYKNYSGLDVLELSSGIKDAIAENANGENYEFLKNIVEVILTHPNTCPVLYQFAALSTVENLSKHTFVSEIISLSYADPYLQMMFLIFSSSPKENIEALISDILQPILDFEEDFKKYLSTAVLATKIQVVPSLYKKGIECLIEYLRAFM